MWGDFGPVDGLRDARDEKFPGDEGDGADELFWTGRSGEVTVEALFWLFALFRFVS